jgi:hypothetical protein
VVTAEEAIAVARRIRRNLLRRGNNSMLRGMCGVASLELAIALDDVSTLRGTSFLAWHFWNQVGKTIIDITATQFEWTLRGVLVTPVSEPRRFHINATMSGTSALDQIHTWYEHNHMSKGDSEWKRLRSRAKQWLEPEEGEVVNVEH